MVNIISFDRYVMVLKLGSKNSVTEILKILGFLLNRRQFLKAEQGRLSLKGELKITRNSSENPLQSSGE